MSAGNPHALTQAEFARLQGWNRSTVTRLKQAGRLVLDAYGHVDVAASLARIAETGGMRFDVAERHAAQREGNEAAKVGAGATAGAGEGKEQGVGSIAPPAPDGGLGERRVDARARKESALADMVEMEVEEKKKNLIKWVDVDDSIKRIGVTVRVHSDNMPDRLSPLLAPVSDVDEIHAILSEWVREHQRAVADSAISEAKAIKGQSGS